jgi:hypothetical protein
MATAKAFLQRAPASLNPNFSLVLPLPDGTKRRFYIWRSAVMSPELAAKYPELLTFAGQDADDATAHVRCEMLPSGFHAMITGYGRTYLIEPFRPNDTRHYLSFDKQAVPPADRHWNEPGPGR